VLVGCAAFVVHGLVRMRTAAPTFDEVAHIGAAHDYVARGAYVLNRAHPPFTKQLAGLGLRRLELVGRAPEPPPPGTADDALHWFREQWTCGRALLFGQAEHRPMAVLNAARLPLLLLGLPLILGIGLWVRAIGGEAPAATSIALLALSPSLIAHARLVHNDFAVAVFMILALALAFRLRDGAAAGGVAALAIVVTLALASKYAALLLGPMLVAAVISDIVLLRRGRIALGRWFVVGGAVAVVALFGLSFSTGRFDPGHWWGGLSIFLGDTRTGYEIYCRGRFDADGFWYYFPLLLAVKMPLGGLALVAASLGWLWTSARAREAVAWIVVPAVMFLVVASLLAFQLGVRYVLPALILLLVAGGLGGAWLWGRGRLGRIALVVVLAAHAAESLAPGRDPIGFFNVAAGGWRDGHRWFDDSNVDWGQGLVDLVDWYGAVRADEPTARIVVAAFSSIEPHEWPGSTVSPPDSIPLTFRLLLPDFDLLAISPHLLVREQTAYARLTSAAYPWIDRDWLDGWIGRSHARFRVQHAADGSGAVSIGGARIAGETWLEEARARLVEARVAIARSGDPRMHLWLAWQATRFFERWGEPADAAAAWAAVDALIAQGGARAAAIVPDQLRAERRAFSRSAPARRR